MWAICYRQEVHETTKSNRLLKSLVIILSVLHSEMNYRRSLSKICHLTLNVSPHYLECSNVQLYSLTEARIIDTSDVLE